MAADLTGRLGRYALDTQVQCLFQLPHRMVGNSRQLDVRICCQGEQDSLGLSSFSVTVSIAFGGSQLILAAATLYHEDYVPTAWQTLLVYWASLLGAMLINLFFAA